MVSFRKLERADLPRLLSLKLESFETTHHVTIANMEDQERWFNSLDHHVHTPRSLALIGSSEEASDFGLIKVTGIDWVSRSADLAWDVFKEHRGKGLGKPLVTAGVRYCFDILNLRRLTAEVLENNPASTKCALAAGFVQEGVKRAAVFKGNVYLNSVVYGVLR